MYFVTSDQHFNHRNMWEKFGRPFTSTSEMNETMIQKWNDAVSDEDTVYVLGDFFMGARKSIKPIIGSLNGTIILLPGNHDTLNRIDEYIKCGVQVLQAADEITMFYDGIKLWMTHEPVPEEDQADDVYYLYGHVHDNAPAGLDGHTFHVGVDTNDFAPVPLSDIIADIKAAQNYHRIATV